MHSKPDFAEVAVTNLPLRTRPKSRKKLELHAIFLKGHGPLVHKNFHIHMHQPLNRLSKI